jgi:phage protein D
MSDESSNGLFWPRPSLHVAGEEQPALAAGLLGLLITETASGLYRCEALFGNWNPAGSSGGFLYFDRRLFDFGKSFEIRFNDQVLFAGRIMALEGRYPQGSPPQIMVLADDRMQDLRMTRRTRSFSQSSDADAFRQIASDHGLRPQIDVSGGATYETLAQINQSDLAFLRERARGLDAEVWVDGDTLHVQPRTGRAGNAFEIVFGSRLREFSVIADLAGQRTSVLAHGWDVAAKSALRAQADESAIRGELNGDESGAGILASARGDRVDALAHTAPVSSSEAQAHADALFRACARRFVVGRGVAETDARLRVGGQVDLKGLGPLFSGKYYLSQVRHMFDGTNGIRTEFTGERPGIGRP